MFFSYVLRLFQFKTQAQAAGLPIPRSNFKTPDLGGILHVFANTGAGVIITHKHHAQAVPGAGRQFGKIAYFFGLAAGHGAGSNRQMAGDNLVHLCFHGSYLFLRGGGRQLVFSICALRLRGQPNIRTMVWFKICSAVCMGS